MAESHPQVCVIGGGIIGSWAALHLVEAGVETTLIEQFPLPHSRGSSHGQSRAFRFLGDDELDRLEYSLERWQGLEHDVDDTLFVRTGLLNFGPDGDAYLEKYAAVVEEGGRPCAWMTHGEVTQRWPMLRYPEEWGAVWDPNGGILFAHRCLMAVQRRVREGGGRIVTSRVEGLEAESDGGVRLDLRPPGVPSPRHAHFDQVVVCAGPWTGRLLPELDRLLRVVLTPVTYWRDPTDVHSVARGCPILFNARLTDMYALPSCEYPGLTKVLFHGGPEADPENVDAESMRPFVERARGYVSQYLPDLDASGPAVLERCLYTMTPDGLPIIDRIGEGVTVGAGFSGSGFKHSPATGRMLAALALGEAVPDGFAGFRYRGKRFG